MNNLEGNFHQVQGRYAIVASRFNEFVVEHLIAGAHDTLLRHGIVENQIDLIRAPGAFELPLIAKKVAEIGLFDAVIALGAVIRGGTPHFEYVAGECVKGLGQVALQTNIPILFGVLTVDTLEQAIERAGSKSGNKGCEAAMSALEMVSLISQLDSLKP